MSSLSKRQIPGRDWWIYFARGSAPLVLAFFWCASLQAADGDCRRELVVPSPATAGAGVVQAIAGAWSELVALDRELTPSERDWLAALAEKGHPSSLSDFFRADSSVWNAEVREALAGLEGIARRIPLDAVELESAFRIQAQSALSASLQRVDAEGDAIRLIESRSIGSLQLSSTEIYARPEAFADGTLAVADRAGKVFLLDRFRKKFMELNLGEGVDADLVRVKSGHILVSTKRGRMILLSSSGEVLWSRNVGASITDTPLELPDGRLVVTAWDSHVSWIGAGGELLGKTEFPDMIFHRTPVLLSNGNIVIRGRGAIHVLSSEGRKIRTIRLGKVSGRVVAQPQGRFTVVLDSTGGTMTYTNEGDLLLVHEPSSPGMLSFAFLSTRGEWVIGRWTGPEGLLVEGPRSFRTEWGYGLAPVELRDSSVLGVGGVGLKALMRYSLETGELLWSRTFSDATLRAPRLLPDGTCVVADGAGRVFFVNAGDTGDSTD